jgi:predicted mannosyl-3-phosphoglycerate phosphatase (HAD superfamily)
MRPLVIAADFDGTIVEQKYPHIGAPNEKVIGWLKRQKGRGHKLILWTCRSGERLKEAVEWCGLMGLTFDAVNDDVEQVKKTYPDKSCKVCADFYIDDRNLNLEEIKCELPLWGMGVSVSATPETLKI